MARTAPRATAALVLALALVGCTPQSTAAPTTTGTPAPPAAAAQTRDEACERVTRVIDEAAATLGQTDPTDPAAAAQASAAVAADLTAAAAEVTEPAVAAVVTRLQSTSDALAATFGQIAAGDAGRQAELGAALGELREVLGAYRDLCPG